MNTIQDVVSKEQRIFFNKELELIKKLTVPSCHKYKQKLDSKSNEYRNVLPNPRNTLRQEKTNMKEIESVTKECVESVFGEVMQKNEEFDKKTLIIGNYNSKWLYEKYFTIWKNFVDLKKEQTKYEENLKIQKQKLDFFLRKLKNHNKNEKLKQKEYAILKKHEENIIFENNRKVLIKTDKVIQNSGNNYKNRFKAQKTIIEMQKAKLDEQNKIIQELKLGIMSEDIEKSMEKAKINIREIFANCSERIKYQVPLLLKDGPRFSITSQKAPKIIQEMEQKAVERATKREIILQRKRVIEEIRQKMVAEAIEKKRVLEEDDKKHRLESLREKRRKELELEKIRQTNKQIFMEKWNRAVQFYNRLLIKLCLRKLYNHRQTCRENYYLAVYHYQNGLLRECLNNWLVLVENSYTIKFNIADEHFEYKILKRCLTLLRNVRLDSVRNMQVAEDIFDFRLTSNVFIHWNRFTCLQYIKQQKKIKTAENHYNRWLLFHYFYQWRSLKVVMELEKAKELKKKRWRLKVWEILPDYKPPEHFYT